MAKKDIIPTREIYALYFVSYRFRTDQAFFSFDLDELRKEILKRPADSNKSIYEVEFYLKKPTFKKLTVAQLKKLNLQ
jgi:hypothetical protein